MYKTLKELIKYKNVIKKILDNKISLFKIAKFNFGNKFIEKLKKVNDNKLTKIIKKDKFSHKHSSFSYIFDNNDNEKNNSPNKDSNKINKNNENKTKAKFSPTKLFSSSTSKLFNTSFGEEIHLYEPLSKDKLDFKDFIPILYEPNENDINSDDNTNNHTEDNNYMEEDYDQNNNEEEGEESENENNINNNNEENKNNDKDSINSNSDDNKDLINKNSNDNVNNNANNNNISNDLNNKKEENEINCINSNSNINGNINNIIPPKGSTLRIFNGKIRMNHNRINKVSLLSINKYEKIKKFPKFENELILPSKAKTKEVLPYCKKHLKNKSRIYIYGWLEPDLKGMNDNEKDDEINKFIEIINEFELKDKCSCLINQKIKLYIFVINDNQDEFNKKIISKFDFIDAKLKEKLKILKKYLIYVILSNSNDLNSENNQQEEKINPEIIKLKEKPDEDTYTDDENGKLEKLFSQKDFDINSYAEKNFKNLSPQEMSNKLLKLNEENRIKLTVAIQKYMSNQNNNNSYNNINNQNVMTPFYNYNNNMMNNMYMYQMDKQQKNMNINMNINNINNGALLYYNQPMNIYGNYNQNFIK